MAPSEAVLAHQERARRQQEAALAIKKKAATPEPAEREAPPLEHLAPRWEIHCQDCGAAHRVVRSDAVYCPPCRLIRQLTLSVKRYTRSKRCKKCRALFRPAFVRDKQFCGACEDGMIPAAQRNGWTRQCVFCKGPVADDIPVKACRKCLKDPGLYGKDRPEKDEGTGLWSPRGAPRQQRVLAALVQAQSKRQATNHATLAAIAAGQPHIHRLTQEETA